MSTLIKRGPVQEPALPVGIRHGEDLTAITAPNRRPRLSSRGAQAHIQQLLATTPEAVADALRPLVDRFNKDVGFLIFATDTFEGLATGGDNIDHDLAEAAWATLLCTVVPGPTDDQQGMALIDRLDRLYRQSRDLDPQIGFYEQYETGLATFAGAGPRSALAAADLLTRSNPALALELVAKADDGLGRVLVSASAHGELDEFPEAVRLFDRLEHWGHTPDQLNLDDRFAWVQAMTEVGRFTEADQVCTDTIDRLAAEPDVDPDRHWSHVYRIMAGRLAHLQGRFAEGWDHFRAASDDDATAPALRRSSLRLRLMLADRVGAAAALHELEGLGDPQQGEASQATFIDASLFAAGQWADDGSLGDGHSQYFRGARLRGQVAARALLVRGGDELSRPQQLRLALLAGDDRLAEEILEAKPIKSDDRWSTVVLAAVLALRTGDDKGAQSLLGDVLAQRRHDMDLRILHAQAVLFSGKPRAALVDALACTASMPDHILARVVLAECEFEACLKGSSDDSASSKESAENAQQLIVAVSDYRRAADLHVSTRHYLETGQVIGPIGSEPLAPRLMEEVCRRGLHAAIMAQEDLDRLGLRGDQGLKADAEALLDHLRRLDHPCCRAERGELGSRLHRLRHARDRDEPARLAELLDSHRTFLARSRLQGLGFASVGAVVVAIAIFNLLPPPSSETIRATLLAVGVLLMLMPFAASLKIGAVELQRPEAARPAFGRSKALRSGSLLQRGYQLGGYALPATPDYGRSRRDVVEADLALS